MTNQFIHPFLSLSIYSIYNDVNATASRPSDETLSRVETLRDSCFIIFGLRIEIISINSHLLTR